MAFPEAPTSADFRESNPIDRHIVLFGVTVDERLTWSPHVPQVTKNSAITIGLWIISCRRYWVQLYKQLVCPVIDNACPIRKFVANTHFGKL